MDNTIELINFFRAGTRVERDHTIPTLVRETVGHHSCNVALMAIVLCNKAGMASQGLVAYALCHDLAEGFTGDIPAPAKWASKGLSNALSTLEEEVTPSMFQRILNKDEMRIFKCLDMLDYAMKCSNEIHMGNGYARTPSSNAHTWLIDNVPKIEHKKMRAVIQEVVDAFS